MRRMWAVLLLGVVVFTSSCGLVASDAGRDNVQQVEEAQSEPTPEDPAGYESATEVRDAAVNAGYLCQNWALDTQVVGAKESGHCRDYDAFAVFDNEDAVEAAVEWFKSQPGELNLLTGSNWLIKTNRSEIEMVTGRGMEGTALFRDEEEGPQPPKGALESAAEWCEVSDLLADGGKSLTMTTGGDEEQGDATTDELVCVLYSLEVPDHVIAHIEATRALDGQQTAAWSTISARWTYHPDHGLNLTLIEG